MLTGRLVGADCHAEQPRGRVVEHGAALSLGHLEQWWLEDPQRPQRRRAATGVRLALPRPALPRHALPRAALPADRAERLEHERLHARRQRGQVEADPLCPRFGRESACAAAPAPPHVCQYAVEAPLGGERGTVAATVAAVAACACCDQRVPQQEAQRVVAQSRPAACISASHRLGALRLEGLAVRRHSGQEAGPVQRPIAGRWLVQLAHELVEPGPLRTLCRKHWRFEASGLNHTAHREGIEACAERLEHFVWVQRRVIHLHLARRAFNAKDTAHVVDLLRVQALWWHA